jgi:hypothetical protein
LQIDLEARHVFGEPRGEIGLGRDADAVGVQHKVADIAALCGGDDREQLRVQGRLAAADLQQIGLAFAADQRVEHALDYGERQLPGQCRRRTGETRRAHQVAGLVDLDQREAAVLLVIGTETTVIGATLIDPSLKLQRQIARLQKVAAALPIVRLARD